MLDIRYVYVFQSCRRDWSESSSDSLSSVASGLPQVTSPQSAESGVLIAVETIATIFLIALQSIRIGIPSVNTDIAFTNTGPLSPGWIVSYIVLICIFGLIIVVEAFISRDRLTSKKTFTLQFLTILTIGLDFGLSSAKLQRFVVVRLIWIAANVIRGGKLLERIAYLKGSKDQQIGKKRSEIGTYMAVMITRHIIFGTLLLGTILPTLSGNHYRDLSPISLQLELLGEQLDSLPLMKQKREYVDLWRRLNTGKSNTDDDSLNFVGEIGVQMGGTETEFVFIEIHGVEYYNNEELVSTLLPEMMESLETPATKTTVSLEKSLKRIVLYNMLYDFLLVFFMIFSFGLFVGDAWKYVVDPVKGMVMRVDEISSDPMAPIQHRELSQYANFETTFLLKKLAQVQTLLRIGFGIAGESVIKRQLRHAGKVRIGTDGEYVHAIFGFAIINEFNVASECLGPEILSFINSIATVVHSTVHEFGGSVNKNIGAAFLFVWKLEVGGIFRAPKHTPAVAMVTDSALSAFTVAIQRIETSPEILKWGNHPRIQKRYPGWKVKMGFGLHFGWGIEGAIGSKYKMDCSYLSPHVNMAARLESATAQYGVPLLLSGKVMEMMSEKKKQQCRHIDTVYLKGSQKPIDLWCYDGGKLDISSRATLKLPDDEFGGRLPRGNIQNNNINMQEIAGFRNCFQKGFDQYIFGIVFVQHK